MSLAPSQYVFHLKFVCDVGTDICNENYDCSYGFISPFLFFHISVLMNLKV